MSGAHRQPLIAAILVGGASSRFHGDKIRARIGGQTLAERVHKSVARVTSRIVVVGKEGEENPLPGLPFLTESDEPRSSMAGVVRALAAAEGGRMLIVAGDHPFLVPAVLEYLANREPPAVVHVPEIDGRLAPLVAVYDASRTLGALRDHLAAGRLALTRAVRALEPDVVPENEIRVLDPDLRTFLNVNDKAGFERALRVVEPGQELTPPRRDG